MKKTKKKKNKILITTVSLVSVVLIMIGLTFASPPLYRIFCQITGFAGIPRSDSSGILESNNEAKDLATKELTINFDANVAGNLKYKFFSKDKSMKVRPGKSYTAYYSVKNPFKEKKTGMASFNVTPLKAANYFVKVECFCFNPFEMEPETTTDLKILFYIDPKMYSEESDSSEVTNLTLSYTLFEMVLDEEPEGVMEHN